MRCRRGKSLSSPAPAGPCNNWSCSCIHLLLWSARPSEARVTTIATLDCAAAHSLTLPHRPLPPPPGGAGDTWSVCQILTLPSPITPSCLLLLLLLLLALNQPSVRRARGDGEPASILIMSELYSFERNIYRIFVTRRR